MLYSCPNFSLLAHLHPAPPAPWGNPYTTVHRSCLQVLWLLHSLYCTLHAHGYSVTIYLYFLIPSPLHPFPHMPFPFGTHQNSLHIMILSLFFLFKKKRNINIKKYTYILFFLRGAGREKRWERNINVWLPLECPLLVTCSATQACALTRKPTHNPLFHRPVLDIFIQRAFWWLPDGREGCGGMGEEVRGLRSTNL